MAKFKFYLDVRKLNKSGEGQLLLSLSHNSSRCMLSIGLSLKPCYWDNNLQRVINHPQVYLLNSFLAERRNVIEEVFFSLHKDALLSSMTAAEIKQELSKKLTPEKANEKEREERDKKSFAYRFLAFANSKKPSTREIYLHTYKRMFAYVGDELTKLRFEDITSEWLANFDLFLSQTSRSKNARNIHLRNIRAVFNEAIDDELTTFYPFRRVKIRPVATRKRNLKVAELRMLFSFPCEAHAVQYLDIFKLMFMLIGINAIDLCNLKSIDSAGRINFYRAKTNRLYSIKVEPEAMAIIEKYRGENWLLNILDRYASHEDYIRRLNRALKKIGPVKRSGLGGKKDYEPLFPDISTYWARHSWATIAASLDIPRDTIAHALGHGGNTVTDIYIDFDESKVDEANRRVLDWVLYGKI